MSDSPDNLEPDTPQQMFTQTELFSSIWTTPDEGVAMQVIECLFTHREKFACLNYQDGYSFALTKTGVVILEENDLA